MEVVGDWGDSVLDLLLYFQRVVRVRRISGCVALSPDRRTYMLILGFGVRICALLRSSLGLFNFRVRLQCICMMLCKYLGYRSVP